MRAAETKNRARREEWFPIALLAITMLLCARHETAEAEDGGDLVRGLVGRWTFDEGEGTTARDSSGGANHGKVTGGAKWKEGKIGGALEFDGIDDFVSIPNESSFDITGSITVSAWIKVESFSKEWQAIVTKGDRAWRLHRASDTERVGWACSDLARKQVGDLFGKKAVMDDRWHHIAGVLDGKQMSIFVDGTLDASAESSPNISVNDFPVLIGANAQVKERLFRGLIDDVRIYNRALSIDEIRTLSKGDAAPAPSTTVVQKPHADPKDVGDAGRAKFTRIFDGESLKGWKAKEMKYWSIKDGAITGESTKENPCTSNQFIVWQGGEVADFELQLKFRVEGNGQNSGVQFRSKIRPDGLAVGYQADIYESGGYLGGVCDELHERKGPELLTANGKKTVIDSSGKRTATNMPEKATMKPQGEWNDYHITAKGQHIVLRINGVTCSELIDGEQGHFDLTGILGLQLRSGNPMKVQFKDIYLKNLSAD